MKTMSNLDKNLLLTGKKFEEERAYWFEKLDRDIFMAGIPIDYGREDLKTYKTEVIRYKINEPTALKLFSMAKNSEYALYILLLSCVQYLFYRYNGQEDLTVGMPMLQNNENKSNKSNILAIRSRLDSKTFRELLMTMKVSVAEAERNQNIPFNIVAEQLGIERDPMVPLIRTVVRMNGIHEMEFVEEVKPDTVIDFHTYGKNIFVDFIYNSKVYRQDTMGHAFRHLANILDQIAENPDRSLIDIRMLSEEEEARIVLKYNQTKTEYDLDKTVQELFEKQVKRAPERSAAVYKDRTLTYRELNKKANQLARVLKAKGIGRDRTVGIMVERSLEMVIGIVGILKAGGAYVPVDPNYPAERTKHILKESGADLLLVNETGDLADFGCDIISLSDKSIYGGTGENIQNVNQPDDLAYVIYTSGSTGKPKGIMIKHRSIVNLVYGLQDIVYKEFSGPLKIALLAPYVFDASVKQIFASLLLGHTLYIVQEEARFEGSELIRYYQEHRIDLSDGTPMHISMMLNCDGCEDIGVKRFLIGGEPLSARAAKEFLTRLKNDGTEIINVYGPSECTVDSTSYRIERDTADAFGFVPIGKPMSNVHIYILDQNRKPVPELIQGELYIAGEGLAKGYIGNPELTEERFVENPFCPGKRMYRTGDLARWLPDGNIEYLGRSDHQVKIRGYRIELGEVETRLLGNPSIKEAAVLVREDREGAKYLCAYVSAQKKLTVQEIRAHLLKELPDYMIPSYFVQIEKMPLTFNGKVDRKALPEPDGNIHTGKEYVAPRNEIEKRLVEVWKDILGVKSLGIHDNYFELGGDSIKALQVSARMHKHKLKMEIKDLFKNPTIEELSKYVKPAERKAYQGTVEGEVPLTPVQKRFFVTRNSDIKMHHYNQTVMLYKKEGFKAEVIKQVFTRIISHHDALRMTYKVQETEAIQYNRGVAEEKLYSMEIFDLGILEQYEKEVQKECSRIQSSIELERGPLVKLGLFKTREGDHLLIVIHHLVVDGVSWRILLEDFRTAYEKAEKGEIIELQEKTDSYQEWAKKLHAYARSKKVLKELSYWRSIEDKKINALPVDHEIQEDRYRDSIGLTAALTEEETQNLLKKTGKAYNTEINDILLTALGLTIKEWTGENEILIDLEGHGRESIMKDIDISRTVGWFTTVFPVVLDLSRSENIGMQLKTVKEDLRRIPDKGVRYGILKYLAPEEAKRECRFNKKAEIIFNYLGQFDEDTNKGVTGVSRISTGDTISPQSQREYKLDISGVIAGGRLVINIGFNRYAYGKKTIQRLVEGYERNLRKIIQHCMEVEASQLTPSDYGDHEITLEELAYIQETVGSGIQEIYALSGMQEGMLFHALMDGKSNAYFQQMSFKLKGDINIQAFEKSFNELIKRHDILRASFISKGIGKPKQVILKERNARIDYREITLEKQEEEKYLEELRRQDRERGFNLAKDLLMRMIVVKLGEKSYEIIWSHHHILMDGWCLSIVIHEFFKIYRLLIDHCPPDSKDLSEFEEVYSYGRYIKWLEQWDKEEAAAYWEDYLQGYQKEVLLPGRNYGGDSAYSYSEISFTFDVETTKALEDIARNAQVTMNAVFQTLWGILLQKYNDTKDVIFGAVVSGRPPELEGVENTIGLFINTVPVRVKSGEGQTFLELVKRIQEQGTTSKNHEYLPLAEIQMLSEQKSQLINNIITFENLPVQNEMISSADEKHGEIVMSGMTSFEQTSYDLDVTVCPGMELYVKFSFNSNAYYQETVRRMEGHLREIVKNISANPEMPVHEISILTEQEKNRILLEFNNKKRDFTENKSVHHFLEEHAERTPERIALLFGDSSVTYRELNEKANQMAGFLIRRGIQREELAAVMLERSPAMVEGILGIWKAGGAYIPIDPDYPVSRKITILRESGVRFLLTQSQYRDEEAGKEFKGQIIDLHEQEKEIRKESKVNPNLAIPMEDLAYVIYTSGSTGKPKGAMIEHIGMMNHIHAEVNELGITEEFVIAQTANHCFDISVWQFFAALAVGGRTAIYSNSLILQPDKFIEKIRRDGISILEVVPSTLMLLMEYIEQNHIQTDTLKYLMVTGEMAKPGIVKKWFELCPDIKVVNAYGPAEASDDVSQYIMDGPMDVQNIPIGKPVQNMNIYITDQQMKLCPIGVPGEICVSGVGVGRGYLNDEERTKQVFMEDPFSATGRVRLYRTGDIGKWLEDGNIEFIGRQDYQVKVRGYRIELGEIENRLLENIHIKEAVVTAKEDKEGNKYLCAYLVAEKELMAHEIREYLTKSLPDYMVPACYIQMEKIPLTPNGKVDRRALPETGNVLGTSVYVPPANEAERRLAKIWTEILGIERPGAEDSFFELGGHSLKAVTLAARIHKEFNKEIALSEIFKAPTIREICRYIHGAEENLHASVEPVEEKEYYEVSSAQKRMYIVNQFEENSINYNMPGIYEIEGECNLNVLEKVFKELVERHETLRTSFEMVEGKPVQRIHEAVDLHITYNEVSEEAVEAAIKKFVRPFELDKVPLLRVEVLQLRESRNILLFDMHHIISDGISMDILAREFAVLYEGKALPALRIQYKDYSVWQNRMMAEGGLKKQEEHWLKVFQGEIPLLSIPADYPRPQVQSFEGDGILFNVDYKTVKGLNRLAKETGATLYMVLLAAYNIVLSKYSGQEDIVVGTPIAGRPHADLENIIGMFVNTLAVRNYPKGQKTFKEFLQEVKVNSLQAYENQDYQFEELVEKLDLKRDLSRNPLFDTMFVFQNAEIGCTQAAGPRLKPYGYENRIAKFDLSLQVVAGEENINLVLNYCTKLFKKETVERIIGHLKNVFKEIVRYPDKKIQDIDMMPELERNHILFDFNRTTAVYPEDKMIHELFEEQAEKSPDHVAVVFEGQRMTYRELNEKANMLARRLREKGVGPDNIVAVMTGRSLEMILGIFGTLKAGGAYLPIDPEYPAERIKHMLEDSNAKVLLTQGHLNDTGIFNIDILNLENERLYCGDISNLTKTGNAGNLAYIIYTSGTTGLPKGVLLENTGLVNYVSWFIEKAELTQKDKTILLSSFCFDLGYTSLFPSLLRGCELHIVSKELYSDPERLLAYLQENRITYFKSTPSLYHMLINTYSAAVPGIFTFLRLVVLGGEPIQLTDIEKFHGFLPEAEVMNHYGPTEATVGCIAQFIDFAEFESYKEHPAIGKPIHNAAVYILDTFLKPVPIGVTGEIHLSGAGLARGYLNRPDLNIQKFIPVSFRENENIRLYKTGDLAKWLPDGSIEYVGRVDHQVKIRGYRVETSEVENRLLGHEHIKEAAVLAKEYQEGTKYLCAYIVAEKELTVQEIREYLSKELPDYMIPSYFIQMEKLPLTPNGKTDRKALPEPDGNIRTGREYIAARNEVEKRLVAVWKEILGAKTIGIRDNFFELGGDSIKALQVSARMHKHQWKVEIRDLFKNPTIEGLSRYVKPVVRKAYQGIIEGEVFLTPIQKRFFETGSKITEMHHYNQSVMLYKKEGFKEEILKIVFTKIVTHHDVLRMVYAVDENKVIQFNRGVEEEELFNMQVFDFSAMDEYAKEVVSACSKVQGSIDLQHGPLVKLGLFKTREGDYLLIAIHHLVMDGVSWRILMEDFNYGYEAAEKGNKIKLQEKTDSFKEWAEKLNAYSKSKKALKDLQYWKSIEEQKIKTLPVDNEIIEDEYKDNAGWTVVLNEEETQDLLKKAGKAYNTEINDLLLAALGLAIKEWTDGDAVLIDLEGHGREEILKDINISRTVGWFTTVYPVVLDMSKSEDIGAQIKMVKEDLRRIPDKGIGYGILKYLASEETQKEYKLEKKAEIVFNYLGQFDEDVNKGVAGVSRLSSGDTVSQHTQRRYKLDINGMCIGGKLCITVGFNRHSYREETIRNLAEGYERNLKKILSHCLKVNGTELTPSDYGDYEITLEELAYIREAVGSEIQEIYSLSNMQAGMLFHALMDGKSSAYFEQISFKLNGSIDIDVFEESFNELIRRHAILRTSFIGKGVRKPKQVVLKERKVGIDYRDIAACVEEKEDYFEELCRQDRERGFDLIREPLMRITVVKLGENRYGIIWSHHHILMDGWCSGIIINELFRIYSFLQQGRSVALGEVHPYKNYIEWLEKQDEEEALEYWSHYLSGYESVASLPKLADVQENKSYCLKEKIFRIEEAVSRKLEEISVKNQVTVNTVLQGIWGILLQRYNHTDDVVFGSVVSGRPSEVEGVEKMVGLFINTIPVRICSEKGESFANLIGKIQERALKSDAHDYVSLAEIQSRSDLKKDLTDHIFVFENYPVEKEIGEQQDGGQGLLIGDIRSFEHTNYDFNIIIGLEKEIIVKFSYNANIYESYIMGKIGESFQQVAETVADNPDILLEEIDIVAKEERNRLIYDFNNTKAEYLATKTLHELFEKQAETTPDHIALIYREQRLTYSELNKKSNQLARLLRDQGVAADTVVGIMVDRSIEMAIGILAILKAGGAYLPIDPEYPAGRIKFMLEDSKPAVLLTKDGLADGIGFNGTVIEITNKSLYGIKGSNLEPVSTADNLAYIIYTSGTAGQPKGVMVQHGSISARIQWRRTEYKLGTEDVVLQLFSFAFDGFITSFFTPIVSGSKVIIIQETESKDPIAIKNIIIRHRVTHFISIPALYAVLLGCMEEEEMKFVRIVTLAGDKLNGSIIRESKRKKPLLEIVNEYGPTEATVASTIKRGLQPHERITIGKPIHNTSVYILDTGNKLAPVGAYGELCIGGVGIARGYLNNPELTDEKFVPSPFVPEERIYRTGDLARWLPDGNIEFSGRIDHQAKIRGYRIEMEEIEEQLLRDTSIKEAVVAIKEDAEGAQYLCAYVVTEKEMAVQEIKRTLSKTLPEYMIPSYFIPIERIPLTPNGKVDRKALPDMENSVGSGVSFAAPTCRLEEILVEIWSRVLGIKNIGIDDDFFALGGNSIKVMQLEYEIYRRFHKNIDYKNIFSHSTVRGLSEILKGNAELDERSMAILNEGSKRKVFAFPPSGAYGAAYTELAKTINEYSFYCFDFFESDGRIRDYADSISHIQDRGPYILLGYSGGGNLAFEVAKELIARGNEVSDIILMDVSVFKEKPGLTREQMTQLVEASIQKILEDNQHISIDVQIAEEMVKSARKKMLGYMKYMNELATTGMVDSNLHLISSASKSGDEKTFEQKDQWWKYTKKECNNYFGYGTHLEMLREDYAGRNAGIVRSILDSMEWKL